MSDSPYKDNPEKFLQKFSMIFATTENGVIGKDNKLLWHLPNDLKRFKKLTENKIVIMGKKTYKSLPDGPLPGRLNVVVCNDDIDFLKSTEPVSVPNTGVAKVPTLQAALNFVHNFELNPAMKNIKTNEYFVIGGGRIYELFLPYVRKIYMTIVHTEMEGDTYMPDIHKYEWNEMEEIENQKDDTHEFDYTFVKLKRVLNAKN